MLDPTCGRAQWSTPAQGRPGPRIPDQQEIFDGPEAGKCIWQMTSPQLASQGRAFSITQVTGLAALADASGPGTLRPVQGRTLAGADRQTKASFQSRFHPRPQPVADELRLDTRYAQRMLIENSRSVAVRFFPMNALSSAVARKIDFDRALTVIASGLYRILAKRMRGYDDAQARLIFRDLIQMPATVRVTDAEVVVYFHRRAHLPIIMASGLLAKAVSMLGQLPSVELQARVEHVPGSG